MQRRDELDMTVSTVTLSEMIAESLSEAYSRSRGAHKADPALEIRNQEVADVVMPLAEIRKSRSRFSRATSRSVREPRSAFAHSSGRWWPSAARCAVAGAGSTDQEA